MKSSRLTVLCLLVIASFDVSKCIMSSSPSIFLQGRRFLVRDLNVPFSDEKAEYQKIQVRERRNTTKGGSTATEFSKGKGGDAEETPGYHLDYEGVSTHPTPTPKHPNP